MEVKNQKFGMLGTAAAGRTTVVIRTPASLPPVPSLTNIRHPASGILNTPPVPATIVYGRGSIQGGSGFSPRLAAPQPPAKLPLTLVCSTHPFATCRVVHVLMHRQSHSVNVVVAGSGMPSLVASSTVVCYHMVVQRCA